MNKNLLLWILALAAVGGTVFSATAMFAGARGGRVDSLAVLAGTMVTAGAAWAMIRIGRPAPPSTP